VKTTKIIEEPAVPFSVTLIELLLEHAAFASPDSDLFTTVGIAAMPPTLWSAPAERSWSRSGPLWLSVQDCDGALGRGGAAAMRLTLHALTRESGVALRLCLQKAWRCGMVI
jgi:hypothetical protein